jgi:hypothetical protein
MDAVNVVYAFWIALILLILAILIVSGVLWGEHKTIAWYYIVIVGAGMLYLFSAAMASTDRVSGLLERMKAVLANKLGAKPDGSIAPAAMAAEAAKN